MHALIIVDPQNDFFEGGSLEVPNSNSIIPNINKLINSELFDLVIITKDWHPSTHKSFASQHEGKNVFETINLNGINQVLWPDHCVQNTFGAEIHKNILVNDNCVIFTKGENVEVDSYSGFYDNDHKQSTGLSEFLKSKGVTHTFICGLALDYCCKFTALDSASEGFVTSFIVDATMAITTDIDPILHELSSKYINLLNTDFIEANPFSVAIDFLNNKLEKHYGSLFNAGYSECIHDLNKILKILKK